MESLKTKCINNLAYNQNINIKYLPIELKEIRTLRETLLDLHHKRICYDCEFPTPKHWVHYTTLISNAPEHYPKKKKNPITPRELEFERGTLIKWIHSHLQRLIGPK